MTIIEAWRRATRPAPIVPLLPPAHAPAAPTAGTISTPMEAVCAVRVALTLTYGDDAARIWRLSGLRTGADWRPDVAHEDLRAHLARRPA